MHGYVLGRDMPNKYDPSSEGRRLKVFRCMHRDDTRAVLRSLKGISERNVADLSSELATDWCRSPREVRSILYDESLPLLESAALVVYDEDAGVVERGDAYGEIKKFPANMRL